MQYMTEVRTHSTLAATEESLLTHLRCRNPDPFPSYPDSFPFVFVGIHYDRRCSNAVDRINVAVLRHLRPIQRPAGNSETIVVLSMQHRTNLNMPHWKSTWSLDKWLRHCSPTTTIAAPLRVNDGSAEKASSHTMLLNLGQFLKRRSKSRLVG